MKLNLGSGYSGNDALFQLTGTTTHPDWIFVDCAEHYRAAASKAARFDCYDFADGIREPDNSIEVIWMGDALEHVWKFRARFVLEECLRVLVPGGQLIVSVPDMGRVMSRWLTSDGENEECLTLIYGQQDERDQKNCVGDSHKNGFTENSLGRLLKLVGFAEVLRIGVHKTWFELAMSARKP